MRFPLTSHESVGVQEDYTVTPVLEENMNEVVEDVWMRNELAYLSVPTMSSPPPLSPPLLNEELVIEVPPLSQSELDLHREAEEVSTIQ